MDILRSGATALVSLISKMNATHYSDAASQRAVRRAQRRKTLRKVAFGSLAVGLVAGVLAVESPSQGGLFSRLGRLNDFADQKVQSADESRGGLNFTTGFYEFDDGPEEDVRKGRQSRKFMAQTTSPFYSEEYYEDPDLSASRGFFGLWASFEIGGTGEPRQAREEREGVFSKLADATTSQRMTRVRTRKARDGGEDNGASLFSRLFSGKQIDEADSAPEPAAADDSDADEEVEAKSGGRVSKFLSKIFSAKGEEAAH